MSQEEFEVFKEKQLKRFRKYYRECYNNRQRNGLKHSLYDNPNLTKKQKDEFWKGVLANEI